MTSAELVDCNSLLPGARIEVETRNRRYQIECLGGNSIRISGHPQYCPTPVRGHLEGSSDKEGVLEPGLIGRGMHLRLLLEDRLPVTTSRVLRVRLDRTGEVSPKAPSTIQ